MANVPKVYLPTFIYDTEQVKEININTPEFKNFLVTLTQTIGDIISAVNYKETGYYPLQEVLSSKLLFNTQTQLLDGRQNLSRNGFRTIVNFGALPNAATKSIAHNIQDIGNTFSFIIIDGCATDPAALTFIKVPFSSPTLNENIKVTVDATNINITTAIDYTSFTTTYIILEYIKT